MRKALVMAVAAAGLAALARGETVSIEADFTTNRDWRVYRDIPVKGGMSDVDGVEFDFRCSDLSAFSSFTLYFRSGNGWYKAEIVPELENEWQRIRVAKSDADRTEEHPGGWGGVTALRFSGSRGSSRKAIVQIDGLKTYSEDAKIVTIRFDSGKQSSSDAVWATKLASSLKSLGLASRQMSESDLTEGSLDGIKIVALPYNPKVTSRTLDILRSHVGRGGRLLVCYVMPKEVADLIGVEPYGDFVPASQADAISGFLRVGTGLDGQPAFAPQSSWRSVRAKPAGGGRVVAEWADRNRRTLGVPALIRTPNAIYMSHIWNGGCDAASLQLMRSVVADLSSELREGMAAFTRNAEIRREGYSRKAKAVGLKDGERRLAWCHKPYGYDAEHDWDASVRLLKEYGYTDLIANLCWGGLAFYRSDVLPVSDLVASSGDALDQCLAACKKYGIRLHVWKVCWRMNFRVTADYREKMRNAGRTQMAFDGREMTDWLCPSNPENQRTEIDAMLELARRGVDGVHFDYIRYTGREGCFCNGCRSRFEASHGRVSDWPAGVRKDAALQRKWNDFRRDSISSVVRSVAERLHGGKSGVSVSAAVFQMQETCPDTVGQDWPAWCRNGWLDFVCPMDYTQSAPIFRGRVKSQMEAVAGVKLYPGIGLSCWRNDGEDVRRLCEQIEVVRGLGLEGYTVFELTPRAVEAFKAFR